MSDEVTTPFQPFPDPKTHKEFWSNKYGRLLSDYEVDEIKRNVVAFFDLLYEMDQRNKAEAAARTQGSEK